VVAFYEGKVKQQQSQLLHYEEKLQAVARSCDEQSNHKSQVEELVILCTQMRKENEELGGRLETRVGELAELKEKYFKLRMRVSLGGRHRENNEEPATRNSRTGSVSAGDRSARNHSERHSKNYYGNLQSKINRIEGALKLIRKENARLQDRLD
jgi:uncharacterized protein (DUF342 family)